MQTLGFREYVGKSSCLDFGCDAHLTAANDFFLDEVLGGAPDVSLAPYRGGLRLIDPFAVANVAAIEALFGN